MFNTAFAKLLSDMADLLELDEDNPFRIRAFRRAAEVVESFPGDLARLDRKARLEIPGIGKGVADMMEEYAAKGGVAEFNKLLKKFPEGVLKVMKVQGLGAKRAATLYKELRIDSVEKLEKAARAGRLRMLPRFGEKLENSILKSITGAGTPGRLLVTEARAIAATLSDYLRSSTHVKKLELAGSARRWKETVGDIDLLCISDSPEKAITHFLAYPGVSRVLASGSTKASVVLRAGPQCDFRVVPPESFGAALLYFTGSKEHNVRLREIAQKKGLTLNEYGLFRVSDDKQEKPVAGRAEEDVYRALGLEWIPPELREDRGEIDAAAKKKLPKLVTEADVLGDFHNHTELSDGVHTLEAMAEAAKARGWKWFFSADHSPSLKIARGLPAAALRAKIRKVRELDKQQSGFRLFCSSEVDILADGKLDYPDEVLAELDCVVASVHTRFNQSEDEMTERLCRAIRHRHVDILGHASGRKLNRRPSYAMNYEAVFEAAKETQTAIEINGQPERQELADIHVRRAIELGVPLAVTTDGHSTAELGHMTLAVQIARRGWAEPKHIINCMSADRIREWLS